MIRQPRRGRATRAVKRRGIGVCVTSFGSHQSMLMACDTGTLPPEKNDRMDLIC